MKLPYGLRRRKEGGNWMVRGTYNGLRVELSTGHQDEAIAWMFAAELWEAFENDELMNRPLEKGFRRAMRR